MWYLLIVITNQTWVGAWFYTKQQAEKVNNKIEELLWFKFDGIYSCYHSPDDNCSCRKPNTWLLEQALKDFSIDLKKSWFVGDKEKDVLTGKKFWIKTCYVWKSFVNEVPDLICNNLLDFVNKIEKIW